MAGPWATCGCAAHAALLSRCAARFEAMCDLRVTLLGLACLQMWPGVSMLWVAKRDSAPHAPTAIFCGMLSCRMCVCTDSACAGVACLGLQVCACLWSVPGCCRMAWRLCPASLPITDISSPLLAVVSGMLPFDPCAYTHTQRCAAGLCLPAHEDSATCAACLVRGWCRHRLGCVRVHLMVCFFNRLVCIYVWAGRHEVLSGVAICCCCGCAQPRRFGSCRLLAAICSCLVSSRTTIVVPAGTWQDLQRLCGACVACSGACATSSGAWQRHHRHITLHCRLQEGSTGVSCVAPGRYYSSPSRPRCTHVQPR